jgi:glutamine synthetase
VSARILIVEDEPALADAVGYALRGDGHEVHAVDDGEDALEAARYVQSAVIEAMNGVRAVADRLEKIVPDDLWPLPKYSEILFIK